MTPSKHFLDNPVQISSGFISGNPSKDSEAVYTFKGIPFAAPPEGKLRWKPPQSVPPWNGIRKCFRYGNACPQPKMVPPFGRDFGEQSEDCLYLNIWSGARNPEERLPVMVWIHGGGFFMGSGSAESYDGTALAQEKVILVTINYRLGPFGFMGHRWLSEESDANVSGNYGLLDQIAALQWIHENIHAFGGDPECVLVFGESGGARSVCFLMATPLSRGLFSRAVVQSGSLYRPIGHLRQSRQGLPAIESQGESFARKLGCDSLDALRAVPADTLLRMAKPKASSLITPKIDAPPDGNEDEGMVIGPCIDGWVFPDDPVNTFRSGKQHDVPMVIGSNKDEMSMFLGRYREMGAKEFKAFVTASFPNHYETVLSRFPVRSDAEVRNTLNRLMTELTWTRPARATARNMASVPSNAYLYYLTQHRPGDAGQFGASHGVDIRYVFGHNIDTRVPMSDEEWRLSRRMQRYWLSFAASGDPNGPGLPEWPIYNQQTNPVLELGPNIRTLTDLHKDACDLFDRIDEDNRG